MKEWERMENVGGQGGPGEVLSWGWEKVMRLRHLAQPPECNVYSINVPDYAGQLEKLTQQDSRLLGGKPTAS